MTPPTGTLYGIGVGPGDPDLLTFKAARILGRVDVIFTAASAKNNHSIAVEIARPHIPPGTAVRRLPYPMTRDRAALRTAWQANAQTLITELDAGRDVAFLTLGDPLTYSTFGYTLKYVRAAAPHVPVETVPGITSYQAAAAALNVPLVEGEEALLIMSGVKGGDRLRQLTITPENVVFLKSYRNVRGIAGAIEEAGMLPNSFGVRNCGHDDQEIVRDIRALAEMPPHYLTLIIAKRPRGNESA
ncbi:MAG: precorrin-2 C(20)-methyltransferase [Desulfobacteraceae bacterium]|jgi:precorrin-2/cobalt-factor-2 C20-methyltransferase|nr:precorrin-2 C(20)-methyltransferase [Desulfobacteraceae bacterium]